MKLVFKYKHYDNMYSKGYTKICISYKEINEVSIVTEKKFLDEIFLSSYLDDLDLRMSKWVLEKLKNKIINREEIIYALEKWKKFLEKEITDPSYKEIIDTDDLYKK